MNEEFWVEGQDVLSRTGEIRAKPAASARPPERPERYHVEIGEDLTHNQSAVRLEDPAQVP